MQGLTHENVKRLKKVNQEHKLDALNRALDKLVYEFVVWWGTCHADLAKKIDALLSEIEELEETIKLEKTTEKIKKRLDK